MAEVRHLRRDASAPPPAATRESAPQAQETRQARAAEPANEGFVSPFEDELDVPTFLRRRRDEGASQQDDREVPAFLRRSAD